MATTVTAKKRAAAHDDKHDPGAEILTVEGAAELLRFSTWTIMRRIKDGTLPATKWGNEWRIKRADVLALFEPQPPPPKKRGRPRTVPEQPPRRKRT